MCVAIERDVNVSAILDVVFPPACVGCGSPGVALCSPCSPRARDATRFERAGVSIVAAGAYTGSLRRAILALKRGRRDAAEPLARILAEAFERERVSRETIVIAVPTTSANAAERGFDQGIVLARVLARRVDRPVLVALRKRPGANQRGRTRLERLRAARRFEVTRPELVADADVVLVDDVVTTGATLADCAATLAGCGARVRGAFVLAHA